MIDNLHEYLYDPHTLKPWKFPNPSVDYNGVIEAYAKRSVKKWSARTALKAVE